MSIETKTLGMLIDELITTSMKCWHAQETICKATSEAAIAKAAQDAQSLNARRNALIQAIDRVTGQKFTVSDKTY